MNYVAARPENVPQLSDAIHAEDHLLGELRRLWNNYRNHFRQTPTFMLLYSWIMPCPDCTNLILNYFQAAPFVHVDNRYVVHSTEGLYLPYMSLESNNRSRQLLRNAGIGVLTHNCFSLPPALKGPSNMSRPLPNVHKTTTTRTVAVDTLDRCYEAETMQGRLLVCLNRGSYMSAHVLLNLLNELGKRDKMRGLPSILSLNRNEFNKFNNTRARMLDSVYHISDTLKSGACCINRH